HENSIDPFGGKFANRIAQTVLPPIGDGRQVLFEVPALGDVKGIPFIYGDINREIHIGCADSCGIECEAADLHSKTEAVLVLERAIENGFSVSRRSDDLVWRAFSDFYPVALRIDKVKHVVTVSGQLAADDRVEIE